MGLAPWNAYNLLFDYVVLLIADKIIFAKEADGRDNMYVHN